MSIEIAVPKLIQEPDGRVTLTSECTVAGVTYPLYFKVNAGPIACGIEPFLSTCLFSAMKLREDIHLNGCVSPRLLHGISRIQETFSGWFPELQPVSIHTTPAASGAFREGRPATKRGVACFFSGGVDSFYSTLKHQDEIDTLLLVHGFDIDVDATDLWNRVRTEMRTAAAALGKRLIEIETNTRSMTDKFADWGNHQHGAMLAAVVQLLAPQLSRVYVPSSYASDQLHPWGSHPDVDPLWSTEEVEIIHDGNEAKRIQKVEVIATSDVAMQHLRVCWENRQNTYNCGRCEKCIRTQINLRVVGAQDRCRLFARPASLWTISRSLVREETKFFVEENLAALRARGTDPALERALQDSLDGRYYRGPWKIARQLWWKIKKFGR